MENELLNETTPGNSRPRKDGGGEGINEERQERAAKVVQDYIRDKCSVFRELEVLREKGWANPEGDRHFAKQRKQADSNIGRDQRYFFYMMQHIAGEMNKATGAFSIGNSGQRQTQCLDLCLAPGGYAHYFLQLHPEGRVCGTTLPSQEGGHRVILNCRDSRVTVQFLDVTLLLEEMLPNNNSIISIPMDHPDVAAFSRERLYPEERFDLVICDGQTRRTHDRHGYRNETVEPHRLLWSQLVIGLERMRDGGNMIVLLHKAERWQNLELIHTFSKFSEVQLFKPSKCHANRSSFYLVATSVRPRDQNALDAVASWKTAWISATFGAGRQESVSGESAQAVLAQFGEEYLRLATPVWHIQQIALGHSTYCRDVKDNVDTGGIEEGTGKLGIA